MTIIFRFRRISYAGVLPVNHEPGDTPKMYLQNIGLRPQHRVSGERGVRWDRREMIQAGNTLLAVSKRNSELLSLLNSLPAGMKKMMRNGK